MLFEEVPEEETFCQGDVLQRRGETPEGGPDFGIVITADCDIIQDKAGEALSVLRIQTAESYLMTRWARAEIERIKLKQIKPALETLNSAVAKLGRQLAPLEEGALTDWLTTRTPSEIAGAVGITGKSSLEEICRTMECISHATSTQARDSPFETLQRMWVTLKAKPKVVRGRLADVLDPSRGPGDIFFLPYLPSVEIIGFVILLRDFYSVPLKTTARSPIEGRISASDYVRIGRCREYLKYCIVQRMATLFSRIALTEQFESEVADAQELVVDSMCDQLKVELS